MEVSPSPTSQPRADKENLVWSPSMETPSPRLRISLGWLLSTQNLHRRIPLPKPPPATPLTPRAPARTQLSLLQAPSPPLPTMPPATAWSLGCLATLALLLELTPLLSTSSMDSFWEPLADYSLTAGGIVTTSPATAPLELTAVSHSVLQVGVHPQVESSPRLNPSFLFSQARSCRTS